MNNELFEVIDPTEEALKNTPEEEAFRLANSIFPMEANTLKKPPEVKYAKLLEYNRKTLVKLAHFVNPDLTTEQVAWAGMTFGCDYNDCHNDDYDMYWFEGEGMINFLKWCEPREKDLFNQ